MQSALEQEYLAIILTRFQICDYQDGEEFTTSHEGIGWAWGMRGSCPGPTLPKSHKRIGVKIVSEK